MTLLRALKRNLPKELTEIASDLISIAEGTKKQQDKEGEQEPELKHFVKIEAEIPRGNGWLSRIRFEVKIPDGKLKVTPEELENSDYSVTFSNLTVTYIDSMRDIIYFAAEDYEIEEVS